MDLKHLKSFLSVAKGLSFRKAAQRAGVTQPALSQHVAKLEAELGTRLFVRDRRTVTLTPAGQTLCDEAPGVLAALERVIEATRRVGGLREKTLRVGQLQYSSHAYLPGALQSLQRARPDVLVELVELPAVEAVAAVKEGVVDIGFGLGPNKDVDLVSRDVIHGRWVVWLPRKHPLAALDEVPVTALASESVILFSRSLNPGPFEFITRQIGSERSVAHQVQQPHHGIPLVLQGLGVFVAGSYIIQHAPAQVVCRPLCGFDSALRVTAVWRPDGRQALLRPFLAGLPRLKR